MKLFDESARGHFSHFHCKLTNGPIQPTHRNAQGKGGRKYFVCLCLCICLKKHTLTHTHTHNNIYVKRRLSGRASRRPGRPRIKRERDSGRQPRPLDSLDRFKRLVCIKYRICPRRTQGCASPTSRICALVCRTRAAVLPCHSRNVHDSYKANNSCAYYSYGANAAGKGPPPLAAGRPARSEGLAKSVLGTRFQVGGAPRQPASERLAHLYPNAFLHNPRFKSRRLNFMPRQRTYDLTRKNISNSLPPPDPAVLIATNAQFFLVNNDKHRERRALTKLFGRAVCGVHSRFVWQRFYQNRASLIWTGYACWRRGHDSARGYRTRS
jgi:hypothetical protein